jgi:Glycosyltransferase family 87
LKHLIVATKYLRSFIAKHSSPAKIRFYCILLLTVNVALVAARFVAVRDGQTVFGYPLARDYTAFYVAGKIANEYSFTSAYDMELQSRIYHELLPHEPPESELPFVNPPFLLIPFSILARLPYAWAFAFWLALSVGLYIAGLLLMLRSSASLPRESYQLILLLAVSFAPFLVYCWGLGQLSSIGVFCLASAIYLERRNKLYLSGVMLALCLYKPTLLLLLTAMLFVTCRFRQLAGFISGVVALVAASVLLIGWRGFNSYVLLLRDFGRWKGTANTVSQTSLYIDIRTAFKLVTDLHPQALFVIDAVYIGGLVLLVWAWWRFGNSHLVWAVTITFSLIFNVYTPLYDTAILVIPAILFADYLYGVNKRPLPNAFKAIVASLYLFPLAYSFLRNIGGFQIYTFLIAAFGIYQLRLLAMSSVRGHCDSGISDLHPAPGDSSFIQK